MARLKISETRDRFERDGKPFFYLADSVWPAFAKISLAEWEHYLDFRNSQGFNVLHIWLQNKSIFGDRHSAFHFDERGRPDYNRLNHDYFQRASEMLAMASDRGFIPAIALLWADKVKDTWLSRQFGPEHIMPLNAVGPYVQYVAETFDQFEPVYMVGGDTSFESTDTSAAHLVALDVVKSVSPESLTTLHLWGDSAYMPDEIVNSEKLDFYLYQSGHKSHQQHCAYEYAQELCRLPVKRPIVNGEPCFEGLCDLKDWGKTGNQRFGPFDVRKAIWQSLLSGAKAGVGYGAFGVWPWFVPGEPWQESWLPDEDPWEGTQYFGTPYHWRTALGFPGAWDASFARFIFESFDLVRTEPRSGIRNGSSEIRMSATDGSGTVAIYIPYPTDVTVGAELSEHDWVLLDLAERKPVRPEIQTGHDSVTIRMAPFNSDALAVGVKR